MWIKDMEKEVPNPTEWSQTDDKVQITFCREISPDEVKNVNPTFTDSTAHIVFPDESTWTCSFFGLVNAEKCRLQLKNKRLSAILPKRDVGKWPSLQESQDVMGSNSYISEDSNSTDRLVIDLNVSDHNMEEKGVRESSEKNEKRDKKDLPTSRDKIEEEVRQIQHTKHDYIEKNDQFVVHVYVKETDSDAIKVQFGEKNLTVLFKTKEQRFLSLHEKATEDTVFCWNVELKHEIIPSKSKFRVTKTMIEITLSKKEPQKWNSLEVIQRKAVSESQTASKSDSWKSVSGNVNHKNTEDDNNSTEGPNVKNTKSSVAFDDLRNVRVRDSNNDIEDKYLSSTSSYISRESSQKPTCKVSPMNKQDSLEQLVAPGFTGLDNLGNTCFMNSVLQALANTREFRDFFLNASFQKDLNTTNPLGSGGNLAVSFALLLKVLWSAKHYSYAPSKLKNLVAMKASQFTGFAQHDAQEFMAFLLDGLHEDLNRVREKPYTETVDSDGRPDDVVANEAWEVYKKRNDSFIVDLFQGQYKSKLTCPKCDKVSITFDPFLYLSVPLPKVKRILPVYFFWRDPYKKPLKLLLSLSKDCTTDKVKEEASKKTGIRPSDMRVFEAFKGKVYKIYEKNSDWANVQANDTIIINEVISEEIANEPVFEVYVTQRTLLPTVYPSRCADCHTPCQEGSKLKRCTRCFKVGYCDTKCQKKHWEYHKANCKLSPEPVGCPFVLSIPESRATFSRVCSTMEAYARYSVEIFQPPVKSDNSNKFYSQPSISSSLSSSSQSSGSMNSLDSQSSFSSSCTITAEQEEKGMDSNDMTNSCDSNTSMAANVGGSGEGSCEATSLTDVVDPESDSSYTNIPPCQVSSSASLGENQSNFNSEEMNLPEYTSFKLPQPEAEDMAKDTDVDPEIKTKNTNPVIGIKTDDLERPAPLFFIKPVNQDSAGLKGPDGERLDDKGDVPLDLSYRKYLSMDWKNNEHCTPHVLVQSKEMDCDREASDFNENNIGNNCHTLQQCLELFTEPEILSPDEAWYCPKCKAHREATKQMSLWKLPHTLIIQLKRFSFRNFIWRDKIDKMVEFPLRNLDMSPFFVDAQHEGPALYDLYAVVNHYGGILGGHYTSYVRCADIQDPTRNEVGWRLCDDSKVSMISNEKSIVSKGAYLLFYRKKEPFKIPCQVPTPLLVQREDSNSSAEDAIDVPPPLIDFDYSHKPTSCDKHYVHDIYRSNVKRQESVSDEETGNDKDEGLEQEETTLDYTDMEAVD